MSKTQTVELVFEKNGTNWGVSSDIVRHTLELPIPDDGFDQGVHLVGAKVKDSVHYQKGKEGGARETGYVTMVAELVTQKDIEAIVGSVLTIVDATITDQAQRKAFKSLIKQAIYNRYNTIIEKSHQMVGERGYRIDSLPSPYLAPAED